MAPKWPLQAVDIQFLGIGTISQVKRGIRWLECIGPEGQKGWLKPYMADIEVNLQQWNTQIKIPPHSGVNQRLNCASKSNVLKCYKENSPAV